MNKKSGIGGKILLGATAVFFYLPILYIIVFSFNDNRLFQLDHHWILPSLAVTISFAAVSSSTVRLSLV